MYVFGSLHFETLQWTDKNANHRRPRKQWLHPNFVFYSTTLDMRRLHVGRSLLGPASNPRTGTRCTFSFQRGRMRRRKSPSSQMVTTASSDEPSRALPQQLTSQLAVEPIQAQLPQTCSVFPDLATRPKLSSFARHTTRIVSPLAIPQLAFDTVRQPSPRVLDLLGAETPHRRRSTTRKLPSLPLAWRLSSQHPWCIIGTRSTSAMCVTARFRIPRYCKTISCSPAITEPRRHPPVGVLHRWPRRHQPRHSIPDSHAQFVASTAGTGRRSTDICPSSGTSNATHVRSSSHPKSV